MVMQTSRTRTMRIPWLLGIVTFLLVKGVLQFRAETNSTLHLTGHIAGQVSSNLFFKCESGEVYQLPRSDHSAALFLDTNLWNKTLVLKGELKPVKPANIFELTGNLHSLKEGKLHELYYYCDICSISSSRPGLCQCCREPSRLMEEPSPAH